MKPKTLYVALCALGIILPYPQFIPWTASYGLNPALMLLVFIGVEGSRGRIAARWLPVLAPISVGVSLALPLLYLRELGREREAARGAAS